jgi:hypothetical protein
VFRQSLGWHFGIVCPMELGSPPSISPWAALGTVLDSPLPQGPSLLPVLAAATMTLQQRKSTSHVSADDLSRILSHSASHHSDDSVSNSEASSGEEDAPEEAAVPAELDLVAAEDSLAIVRGVREAWKGAPFAVVRLGERCIQVWKALLPLGWEARLSASFASGAEPTLTEAEAAAPASEEPPGSNMLGGRPIVVPGSRSSAAADMAAADMAAADMAAADMAPGLILLPPPPRISFESLVGWDEPGGGTFWLVVLFRSGRFAAAVFDPSPLRAGTEERTALPRSKAGDSRSAVTVPRSALGWFAKARCLVHTTHHAYTVRRKQGGAQSSRDSSGAGRPRSMGAKLRREGERKLRRKIAETFASWGALLQRCSRVYLGCAASAEHEVMSLDVAASDAGVREAAAAAARSAAEARGEAASSSFQGLSRSDPRIRRLPFPIGRPGFEESCVAFTRLLKCEDLGDWEDHLKHVAETAEELAPPSLAGQDSVESTYPGAGLLLRNVSSGGVEAMEQRGNAFAGLADDDVAPSEDDADSEEASAAEEASKEEQRARKAARSRNKRRAKRARDREKRVTATAVTVPAPVGESDIPAAVMVRARSRALAFASQCSTAASTVAATTSVPQRVILAALEGRGLPTAPGVDTGMEATKRRLILLREAAGVGAGPLLSLLGWEEAAAVAACGGGEVSWGQLKEVSRTVSDEDNLATSVFELMSGGDDVVALLLEK